MECWFAIGADETLEKKKSVKPNCCDDGEQLTLPDDATAEELSKLAWAIAHPARIRIVRLLLMRKSCVCGEIVDEMPLAQSTVSQHLKILKDSGLVAGEIDGPRVCYFINKDALKQLKRLLAAL